MRSINICVTVLVASLAVLEARSAVTLTTLYSFSGWDGANPSCGLLQAGDGSFYGTTSADAIASTNFGTVFRITGDGTLSTLYQFSGGDDGAWPHVGLVLGADGNFYGTAHHGTNGWGTIFKISPSGNFNTVAALDHFSGQSDSLLVVGTDGNFYDIGSSGSGTGLGSVFRVGPDGSINVLALFAGTNGFTGWLFSRNVLLQAPDGNFYGATDYGGPEFAGEFMNPAYGTVFSMTPNGSLTTLISFNGTNGAYVSALTLGPDGNLYGTTGSGGPAFIDNPQWGGQGGQGTIFRLATNGVLTILAVFDGTNGSSPNSLVRASTGDFYGTTYGGGTNGGHGTIFKLTAGGTLTSLFSFNGTNGSDLNAALLQASDGSFYGTTYRGGVSNYGTIFRLSITPSAPQLNLISDGNGGYFIRAQGEPNFTCQLQRAPTLSGPWITSAPQTAPATGLIEFRDLSPPEGQAFYRTVQQ